MDFRMRWVIVLCTLLTFAAACGSEDKKPSNNTQVECQTNDQCPNGVCDLATFTCTGGANNTNNVNNVNNSNNLNNMNNSNNVNNTNGGMCGDGVVDGDEICDGNCPATCDDNDACTTDVLTGAAATCDAVCANDPVTACVDGDNCCPAGCDETNDLDCLECGNGVLDANEICDPAIGAGQPGACPAQADCVDNDPCTTDTLAGNSAQCTAECQFPAIVALIDGDQCCPDPLQYTSNDDTDCPAPQMAVGNDCTVDADCPANQLGDAGFCATEVDNLQPGGYCTVVCAQDADCGAGAHCNGIVCLDSCVNNADCRTGYECFDYDGDGSNECAVDPALTDPGTACVADDTCQPNVLGAACITQADSPNFTGGMCSAVCFTDDSLCQDGSHCGNIDPNTAQGLCVDDCVVDADCRAGYGCIDADLDNTTECWPTAGGNGAPGANCTVVQDCTGGADGFCIDAISNPDFANGYCSEVCVNDADCPASANCATLSNGFQLCVDECVTDADCGAGYGCLDVDGNNSTECWPEADGNGVTGDACNVIQDCSGTPDGLCLSQSSTPDFANGYCTESCLVDADCPATAHCSAANDLCWDNCVQDADCRAGYGCIDFDGDNTNECFPIGIGVGSPGDACTAVQDCAGAGDAVCAPDPDWPGGYCLLDCTINANACGLGSSCIAFQGGVSFCLADCNVNADCRTGYTCELTGLGSSCLPPP